MIHYVDPCRSWKCLRINSWCAPTCKTRTHSTSVSGNSTNRVENQQLFPHFELLRDVITIHRWSLVICSKLLGVLCQVQLMPTESCSNTKDCVHSALHHLLRSQHIYSMKTNMIDATDTVSAGVSASEPFHNQTAIIPIPRNGFTTHLLPNYHYRTR